jgi:hypothetical protein
MLLPIKLEFYQEDTNTKQVLRMDCDSEPEEIRDLSQEAQIQADILQQEGNYIKSGSHPNKISTAQDLAKIEKFGTISVKIA